MEKVTVPSKDAQRRLNRVMKYVVKNEIIKSWSWVLFTLHLIANRLVWFKFFQYKVAQL